MDICMYQLYKHSIIVCFNTQQFRVVSVHAFTTQKSHYGLSVIQQTHTHYMLHRLTSSSKSLISTSPVPPGRLAEVDGHCDTIGLSTESFKYGKMVSASI